MSIFCEHCGVNFKYSYLYEEHLLANKFCKHDPRRPCACGCPMSIHFEIYGYKACGGKDCKGGCP